MYREGSSESYIMENGQPGLFRRALRRCFGAWKEGGAAAPVNPRMVAPDGAEIRKGELYVLRSPERHTISCIQGIAWVTCPGRFCDYIIHEGESLVLRGSGKLIVSGGSDNVRVRICRS